VAGYTGDSVCTECGKVLSKGMAIPAAGEHVYQDGVCVGCGHAAEKKAELSSVSIVLLVLLAGLIVSNVMMKLKNKPTEENTEAENSTEETTEAEETTDTAETE
jgi:hypothetical protein